MSTQHLNQNIENGIPAEDQEQLAATWQLARSTKWFAVIDLIFSIIYGFSWPVFLLASFLPVAGFWGAREYKKNYIIAYMVFIVFQIIFRGLIFAVSDSFGWYILAFLGIIIEVWILKIVHKFYSLLKSLSEDQLTMLRNGQIDK